MPTETKTIDLTPDFGRLFETMISQARLQFDPSRLFDGLTSGQEADALRAVHRFLWPLTMAAQSMATLEAVEEFRQTMAHMIAELDKAASSIEREIEEDRL